MCFLSHMHRVKLNLHVSGQPVVGAGDKQKKNKKLYTGLYNPLRKRFLRGHPAHFIECNEIIQTSSVK